MESGDYVICGGIIDIYLSGEGGFVCFDLFGDVLDGVCCFDFVL